MQNLMTVAAALRQLADVVERPMINHTSHCVFCGWHEEFGEDQAAQRAATLAHIQHCDKHPLLIRAQEAEAKLAATERQWKMALETEIATHNLTRDVTAKTIESLRTRITGLVQYADHTPKACRIALGAGDDCTCGLYDLLNDQPALPEIPQ